MMIEQIAKKVSPLAGKSLKAIVMISIALIENIIVHERGKTKGMKKGYEQASKEYEKKFEKQEERFRNFLNRRKGKQ